MFGRLYTSWHPKYIEDVIIELAVFYTNKVYFKNINGEYRRHLAGNTSENKLNHTDTGLYVYLPGL